MAKFTAEEFEQASLSFLTQEPNAELMKIVGSSKAFQGFSRKAVEQLSKQSPADPDEAVRVIIANFLTMLYAGVQIGAELDRPETEPLDTSLLN